MMPHPDSHSASIILMLYASINFHSLIELDSKLYYIHTSRFSTLPFNEELLNDF